MRWLRLVMGLGLCGVLSLRGCDVRAQQRGTSENAASTTTVSLSAAWQPLGPAQVSTAAYGLVTGRVTALAVDPSDTTGNTLYVGSTGGGVWKSVNAASASAAFTPLTDTLSVFAPPLPASLSIGALTVQPGATGVVLAGTGDPNNAVDSYYGLGILRSADGGVTWSLIPQSTDVSGGVITHFLFAGNSFAGFAWSTVNPHTVVAAVTSAAETPLQESIVNAGSNKRNARGLFYSQDDGQTWHLATISDGGGNIVQSFQTAFNGPGNAATAVVWNPVRQKFYAAVRFHGYYESADGVSWTRLQSQPGAGLTTINCETEQGQTPPLGATSCPIFRGALAVQPVTGDVFAVTVDEFDVDQGLWQDACGLNGGVVCTQPDGFTVQIGDAALETIAGDGTIPEGTYDLYLAAVPSQGDTLLFAGTQDIFRCSLAGGCAWRNTTNASGCEAAMVAPSQHAVDATFASLGILYFGNDGGLWETADLVNQQAASCSSDDANHYQNLNGGLGSLAEVEDLAMDAGDAQTMVVSLGALGTAATSAGSGAWTQVLGGFGSGTTIDPANDANWYATSTYGVAIDRCTQGVGCEATGFGQPVIAGAQVDGDVQTIAAPWILDPVDSSKLILGTCRVWRGNADGSSWSDGDQLSTMLDSDQGPFCNGNAEIRSLGAGASGATAEQMYAGMAGVFDGGGSVAGHVFAASISSTANAPVTWTDLALSPVVNQASSGSVFNPGGFDVSSIYVDPHDGTGATVYVTVQEFLGNGIDGGLIYESSDAGAHWTDITSNVPNEPVNGVVVDPNDAETVYIATDNGVWVTTNIGDCSDASDDCWSVFGRGLPDAPAVRLAVSASDLRLRVGTYGRGVWEIPLATSGVVFTSAVATPASLNFSAQQAETSSAALPVMIDNTGAAALAVSGVVVTGDFSESDDCEGLPVAAGASCTVNISFAPTQTGARSGVLTVFANVSGGQVTVPLSGMGTAAPSIVLMPLQVSFAPTLIGQSGTGQAGNAQNVTISNTGGSAVMLTSESVSGDFAISANTCGGLLSTNYGCTVSIAFTPTASGTRTGVLTVVDGEGTQTVALSGVGQAPPTDTLSPLSLSFGPQTIGTSSGAQQVMLTNSGDAALQLVSAQATGDFSVLSQCGAAVPGHTSCAIGVVFVPTMVGAETGTLTVSDQLRSQTVSLSGAGLAPAGISATPVNLNFGDYGVGGSSPPLTVTLTNNSSIGLSGLSSAVTGDFSVAAGGCGASVAPGASCAVKVSFAPSQTGTRTGLLVISGDGIPAPLHVALNGNGENFSLQVSGANSETVVGGQMASYSLQIVPVDGSTGNVALACSGAPAGATCTINPGSEALSGAATGFATVSIATAQSGSAAVVTPRRWARSGGAMLAWLLPMGALAFRGRRWRPVLAVYALACFGILGCGLGASAGSTSDSVGVGGSSGNPPSGSYTITVTGSAPGLSQSVQLTLNVE